MNTYSTSTGERVSKEIWKDVPNYEGLYKISSIGRVKSLTRPTYNGGTSKEKILKHTLKGKGYLGVVLSKNGRRINIYIHQLVAIGFLDHDTCGFQLVINHINFNKLDNRVKNLEIVTARENGNQKHRKSTSKYTGVAWYNPTKKWAASIHVNGKSKHLGYYIDETDAHNAYQNELKRIKKGQRTTPPH